MMILAIVLGTGLLMLLVELTRTGRDWPDVAGWWGRALLLNSVQVGMVFVAGVAWDGWLQGFRLFDARPLGVNGSALVGYLAITFIYYWWHRGRHQVPLLWRWVHQLHHSPQRIEVITSFYKHPLEITLNSLLSSAILYSLCGLTPEAATLAVLATGLAELFYHWNVPTPYWIGFILQRPESHCVHHQEGLHSYNFADLPLWDMLFGTFKNPKQWELRAGFGKNEHRLGEMLLGVDVSQDAPR